MSPLIKKLTYILLLSLFVIPCVACAQNITDSAGNKIDIVAATAKKDSAQKSISPRKAAIRSAIIPGWGQVSVRKDLDASFFRKYYSIPLIYTAIGISAGVFAYNLTWYRRTRFAYKVVYTQDTNNYPNVYRKLRGYVETNNATSLKYARDQYRRDLDYSVLFFIAAWGLNVVHASVEAHLKSFDVSDDLSFHIKGGYSELGNTSGISLVMRFK
jgi:hypothetical protein